MKRVLLYLMIAALFLSAAGLTGCGSDAEQGADGVELGKIVCDSYLLRERLKLTIRSWTRMDICIRFLSTIFTAIIM